MSSKVKQAVTNDSKLQVDCAGKVKTDISRNEIDVHNVLRILKA